MLRRNENFKNSCALEPDLAPRGTVLRLMGPTSAGKSTLATRAVATLRQNGVPAIFYDGDEVRSYFGPAFGFSAENRFRVVAALAHLANKAAQAGLQVIVAALTAGEDSRDYVRENVENLMIGYVSCSIDVCAKRDPKGLYRKAINGEIDTLVGYNIEYRPPEGPDLILDTEVFSVEELVSRIVGLCSEYQPTPV